MNASQPADPFEGTDYRVLSHLGSGGMADVFAVEHRRLSMQYAAKLLRPTYASDRRTVDRMRLEAETLAKLEHENVVSLHAYGETPRGLPFIVMDLLSGQTLHELLRERRVLPLRNALVFAVDLLNGLDAVHRLGIVHRDLKPSNLFIHNVKSGLPVLKLLDFGAARVIPGMSDDAPSPLVLPTKTGTTVGTPRFMSPEAAMGRPVDIRSDVYSAGAVLYRMLAGRGPYDDIEASEQLLDALVNGTTPPPSAFLPRPLPQAIEAVVMRALARDPNERFQSAAEFGQALFEIIIELVDEDEPAPLIPVTPVPETGGAIASLMNQSEPQGGGSRSGVLGDPVGLQSPVAEPQEVPSPGPLSEPRGSGQWPLSDGMWKVLVFVALFLITTLSTVVVGRVLGR